MFEYPKRCKGRTKASRFGWQGGKPVAVLGLYMGGVVIAVPTPDPTTTRGYIWVFTWVCKRCHEAVTVSFDDRYAWDMLCPKCHMEVAQGKGQPDL